MPVRDKRGRFLSGHHVGRPRTWKPEDVEALLEHLRNGGSLKSYCDRPENPAIQTVQQWIRTREGFVDEYRQARRLGCEMLADSLRDEAYAAQGKDMAGVNAQRLIVDAIKWELSKRAPEEFGDRLQVTQAGGSAEIHIYLPGKAEHAGDHARVIEGSAHGTEHRLENGASDGG